MSKDMPAFPVQGLTVEGVASWPFSGMTLRQYAAIKLRVPDSGDEWLNDLIRQALRDEFARTAMQSVLTEEFPHSVSYPQHCADTAYKIADALLAARSEE